MIESGADVCDRCLLHGRLIESSSKLWVCCSREELSWVSLDILARTSYGGGPVGSVLPLCQVGSL